MSIGSGLIKNVAKKAAKAAAPPLPPSHSGATSGNFVIPGYQPKTPIGSPYRPSEPGHAAQDFAEAFAPREAHEAAQTEHHEARVQRAEERQKRVVDRYVSKAYSPKQAKATFSLENVGQNAKQAKAKVSASREKLLSHPAVQKANEEGKVVGPKGLDRITQPKNPLALKGPLTHAPRKPKAPAGFGSPGNNLELERSAPAGSGLHTLYETKMKKQEEGEPSTLEDLGYASIGLPGIGVGGEIAKLSELAGEAVPKLFAEGGAKQAAKDAVENLGGKAAAKVAAVKAAPKVAASAVRELPEALRAGIKETPDLLKGAAKAAPKAAGRKALGSTEKTVQGFSALGVLGGAHKAGINVPGGAIIEGQGKALEKDPLKVLGSTANLAPGLLTSAFQLPVAAGASAIGGNPKPLEDALKEQGNYVKRLADTYGSNDASKIEKATLQEGLLPEVLLGPLAAKGIKHLGGDALKGKLEDAVSSRRAPLTDEEGNVALHEHGGPVRKGHLRTGTEDKLTRGAEQRSHRHEEAFHAASMNDLTHLDFARRREEVDKYARKAAGERTPVRKGLGKKGKDTLYERAPDYIPFLVRAGLDLSKPDAAAREIAHYADLYKGLKPAHELGATPEALTARDAVNYFTKHPEKLKDQNLAKAVEAYRAMGNGEKGLRALSTSERNRYLAFAAAHDLPLPEERVPHGAREHTQATTREGAWEDLKGRDKEVRGLRKRAAEKRIEARTASPSKAARLRRESKKISAKAKTIEKGRQDLLDGLKNYTRPWAKANPSAKRIPYDDALEKEFADEARKGLTDRGLNPEPAYIPDSAAILKGTPDQSATGGQKPLPGAPKINEGYAWKNGLSRQGYEHLMNEGILRPVARAYQFEDWRRFRQERGLKFENAFQHTGQEWQKAFDRGLMNPRDVALVPTQIVNRLEKTVKGGDPTDYEQALGEAMSARKIDPKDAQPGTKYEAFPKAAYEEKVAQVQKTPISPILRRANSLTSRTMLSTPSFLGAQVVAETAQAVADVNPGRMLQGLRSYNRLTEEQKLRLAGVGGETAKAIFSPDDLQTTLGSLNSKPFKDSLGFFRRNVFGRAGKDIATMKWAGELDRMKGSQLRRGVLTGQVMRDVNGLWAKGRKLLGVQTDIQKKLDEATKGLRGKAKRDAALAYVAENPDLFTHYGKSLNEAMGGWTNLTRTGHVPENYRAAALLFYPFLRMSLQWPLKYAINHPIKATALAYLAAENNYAIREALGGEPSFLNYAQIPVYGVGKNGEGELINLSRIAPGGNAITEAIQGSGSPLGAIQPVIAAGITGATGQGTYGPVEGGAGEHLKAAGAQILGLSPYVRAADTLRGQKASGQSEFGILAKRANIAAEPLAALEAKLKGSPGSQLTRSLVNPFQPIPKGRAADSAKLGRVLSSLAANSKEKQNKTEDKSKVLKMRTASEKAENELNALYKKYGLTKVAKLSEEVFNFSHPYPGSEGGIYGKKQATESIYGSSASSGSSIYGKEAAPVVPHETSGVSLSIPKIPGLSSVTGAVGSLLGNTPAEAAVPKGEAQKPQPKAEPKPVRLPFLPSAEQQQNAKKVLNIGTRVGASKKEKLAAIETGLVESYGFKNLPVGDNTTGEPSGGWRQELKTYFPEPTNVGRGARNFFAEAKTKGSPGEPSGQLAQTVQGSAYPERYAEHKAEAAKILAAYEGGKGITADLSRGKGNKVYVRADAKGMVNWLKNAEGVQEGSPRQRKWAANEGLGNSEPWCANLVSNGLARRGFKSSELPANPNYTPSYEEWGAAGKFATDLGTNVARIKPGDVLAFSGQHTATAIGNGEMISGNFNNEVMRSPISAGPAPLSMIIRPKYKGGKVAIAAGQPLPGSSFPVGGEGAVSVPAGIAASAVPSPASRAKGKGAGHSKNVSPLKRLQEVERIFAGQTPKAGVIPGYEATQTSTTPDLAAIGKAVEESRKKLIAT